MQNPPPQRVYTYNPLNLPRCQFLPFAPLIFSFEAIQLLMYACEIWKKHSEIALLFSFWLKIKVKKALDRLYVYMYIYIYNLVYTLIHNVCACMHTLYPLYNMWHIIQPVCTPKTSPTFNLKFCLMNHAVVRASAPLLPSQTVACFCHTLKRSKVKEETHGFHLQVPLKQKKEQISWEVIINLKEASNRENRHGPGLPVLLNLAAMMSAGGLQRCALSTPFSVVIIISFGPVITYDYITCFDWRVSEKIKVPCFTPAQKCKPFQQASCPTKKHWQLLG